MANEKLINLSNLSKYDELIKNHIKEYVNRVNDVNDGVLTIKRNGQDIGAFSANSENSITIDIDVPTEDEIINLIEEQSVNSSVQSDWNQTDETKVDFIKNKPIILTEDNVKDLIDEFGGGTQVQSDWNQADETKADFIKNKPDILTEDEIINLIEDQSGNFCVQSDWNQTDTTQLDYLKNKPFINKGQGNNSIVIMDGDATAAYSIAGGTTDKELVQAVTGSSYGNLQKAKSEGIMSIALGANATAYAPASTVLGANAFAGCKGYYFDTIDFNTKEITLSTTRRTNKNIAPTYPSTIAWKAGDLITIKNSAKYLMCSKITSVDGNKITVDSLPFTEIAYTPVIIIGTISYSSIDDRSVINNTQPESGDAVFGLGALSVGGGDQGKNSAQAYLSYALGYENKSISDFGFVTGRNNVGGYANLIGGQDNFSLGDYNTSLGAHNVNKGSCCLVGGSFNILAPEDEATWSDNDKKWNGTWTGKNNNFSTNSIAWGKNLRIRQGYYNAIFGLNNTLFQGSKHFIAGGDNIIDADNGSAVFGTSNKIYDNAAFASGNSNEIKKGATHGFTAGKGNLVTAHSQAVLGKWNKEVSNAMFIVGGGDSDDSRQNLLEIHTNNSAIIGKTSGYAYEDGLTSGTFANNFIAGNGNKIVVRDGTYTDQSATGTEGTHTVKAGVGHVLFGTSNKIITDNNSGAFGASNTVYDNACFAFGANNIIYKNASNAFVAGKWNRVTTNSQAVFGRYNDYSVGNLLFSVGNGNSETTRSNAFTVDGNGNAVVKNKCTVGSIQINGALTANGTNGNLNDILVSTSSGVKWSSTLDKKVVGLEKVDNKSSAEIKTEFTGAVADGNTGFVTGDMVHKAIANIEAPGSTGYITIGNTTLDEEQLKKIINLIDKIELQLNN